MTELTERYVAAALRTIPEKQRPDIEAELRASIGDAIDARVGNGEAFGSAEKEVLTGLGDPDRLAASYTGVPGYLIGPGVYFDYRRLLTVLLITVVPISMVAVAVAKAVVGDGFGSVVGSSFGTGFTVALHLVFWTTIGFAIVERSSDSGAVTPRWTLASLPHALTVKRVKFGETIAAIVFLVLTMAAIVVQRNVSPFTTDDGAAIPLLEPSLWSFWLPFLLAVMGAEVIFEMVKYRVGHWTLGLASTKLVIGTLFSVPAAYLLLTGQLLNQDFFTALGWPAGLVAESSLTIWTVIVIAAITIWDAFDGFRQARLSPKGELVTG
jgi:hypothetical protein